MDRALILAKRERGTRILEPVVTSGAVYDRYFGKKNALSYELAEQEQIGVVTDRNGDLWYAAMVPMVIYNRNAPFEQEEWLLVQVQQESTLMNFYNCLLYTSPGLTADTGEDHCREYVPGPLSDEAYWACLLYTSRCV